MPDMLVKLYSLPDLAPDIKRQREAGITIRRPIPPEKHIVIEWVRREFGNGWASETEVTFSRQPVTSFIAMENGQVIGFACYDATCKAFFGPTGVSEAARGRGTGKALFLACLHGMAADGYAYAIIGAAGPVDFYAKAVGATIIEGSTPGIYDGMLRE
ncbi:MAG: GNAT family N-acetyltransferase [Anaerolineaceae bacterium]|nr:GNAT family N-acetyltransferase [Anaerolineaceae bacterium]